MESISTDRSCLHGENVLQKALESSPPSNSTIFLDKNSSRNALESTSSDRTWLYDETTPHNAMESSTPSDSATVCDEKASLNASESMSSEGTVSYDKNTPQKAQESRSSDCILLSDDNDADNVLESAFTYQSLTEEERLQSNRAGASVAPKMWDLLSLSKMWAGPMPQLMGVEDVFPLMESGPVSPSESRKRKRAGPVLRKLNFHVQLPFAPGCYANSTLNFDKVIGSGMMGSVVLMSHPQNPNLKYAVKSFYIGCQSTAKSNHEFFMNEMNIMKKLEHHHVMKPICEVRCQERLLIVMPYYPRGNLLTELGTYTEVEVCNAMTHLYHKKVAHLDIKLENILLTEDKQIVLTDFGLAREVTTYDERPVFTNWGTKAYWAPECSLSDEPVDLFKLDSYSVGVVLFAFMFNRVPNEDSNYLRSVKRHFPSHNPYRVYAEILLDEDPNSRPTIPTFYNWVIESFLQGEAERQQARSYLGIAGY